jgi:glutathione S-transferase
MYFAAKHGFTCVEPIDEYNAQNLQAYVFEDFMMKHIMPWFAGSVSEEDKIPLLEKCFAEAVPTFLATIERKMPEAGWICGEKLTWIDFSLGAMFNSTFLNPASKRASYFAPAWESAGPKTKAYCERFAEEFKDHLANRPAAHI